MTTLVFGTQKVKLTGRAKKLVESVPNSITTVSELYNLLQSPVTTGWVLKYPSQKSNVLNALHHYRPTFDVKIKLAEGVTSFNRFTNENVASVKIHTDVLHGVQFLVFRVVEYQKDQVQEMLRNYRELACVYDIKRRSHVIMFPVKASRRKLLLGSRLTESSKHLVIEKKYADLFKELKLEMASGSVTTSYAVFTELKKYIKSLSIHAFTEVGFEYQLKSHPRAVKFVYSPRILEKGNLSDYFSHSNVERAKKLLLHIMSDPSLLEEDGAPMPLMYLAHALGFKEHKSAGRLIKKLEKLGYLEKVSSAVIKTSASRYRAKGALRRAMYRVHSYKHGGRLQDSKAYKLPYRIAEMDFSKVPTKVINQHIDQIARYATDRGEEIIQQILKRPNAIRTGLVFKCISKFNFWARRKGLKLIKILGLKKLYDLNRASEWALRIKTFYNPKSAEKMLKTIGDKDYSRLLRIIKSNKFPEFTNLVTETIIKPNAFKWLKLKKAEERKEEWHRSRGKKYNPPSIPNAFSDTFRNNPFLVLAKKFLEGQCIYV